MSSVNLPSSVKRSCAKKIYTSVTFGIYFLTCTCFWLTTVTHSNSGAPARAFRLPGVADMERSMVEWARWTKRLYGSFFLRSGIASVTMWYHDPAVPGHGVRTQEQEEGRLPHRVDGVVRSADYADIQWRPREIRWSSVRHYRVWIRMSLVVFWFTSCDSVWHCDKKIRTIPRLKHLFSVSF
jgi:hypothetical protein